MILLNYRENQPIYEQIIEQIKQLIVKKVLKENEPLPSVRALAMELSINPNTIQRAYQELESQGIIYSIKGKGSYVSSMEQLITDKKKEIKDNMTELIEQGLQIQMTQDEILSVVYEALRGRKSND